MTPWACRRNGCSAGGEAPTALEAVADQWAHFCAEHRQGGGAAVRVVEAPTPAPRGDYPPIESARLLSDSGGLAVILEPGRLINPRAGHPLELTRPAHLGALADVVTESVGAMFITAAGADWLGLPARPDDDEAHPFLDDAIAAGWVVDPPALNWQVRIRRSAESRALPVVFCPYDVDGYALPWSGLAGDELEAGLAAFRTAVGVAAGPSLGSTAERILLATHNVKKGGARLDRTPSLPPAVFELAEIGTTWRRALDDDDVGGWVHWFDANANYLGAYQTAELGRGEVDAWPLGEAREAVADARYLPPALWCADLPGLPDTLPAPWSTSARWHTSPTIARARELLGAAELKRSITAAMRWPLKSRFCGPFGELMRDARRRLLEAPDAPGSAAALAAVTGCYQRLHGRFGAGFREGTRSPWFRPDWMHTIRAQARVNLDRRIRSLSAPPFAVDVDALYFVADDPDPEIVAGRLGLPLGPRAKLGAFRPAGSVELSPALRAALDEVGTAAGTRELLRAAAGGIVPVAGAAMLDAIAPALLEDEAGDEDDLAELVDALRGA